MSLIQDKIINRVRQYGLRAALAQILRAGCRRFYEVNRDIVFIIPDYRGHDFQDACVLPLTQQRIEQARAEGDLDEKQARLLTGFLQEGSQGVCAEVDGRLAGYAWVQFAGEYTFGRTGRLAIPPDHAVMKNLLVRPEYRGCKLGQKLNAARLALVPEGVTPVVFILPENRYAIRNWERLGFRRVANVKLWRLFGDRWRMRLRRLTDHPQAEPVVAALVKSNRG